MRSNLAVRLAIILSLVTIFGLPGLQSLQPSTVDAQTSVPSTPDGDVWTGVVDSPIGQQAAPQGGSSTEQVIVQFRPLSSRSLQLDAHRQAGARRADAISLANTVRV